MRSLRQVREQRAITAAIESATRADTARAPMTVGIQTPFSDQTTLQSVVWADLTGETANIVSREVAMAIPALARQRHILCSTAARCPLVIMAADAPAATTATWNSRTDGELSPYHRTLWTVDDLIFHGWSLWRANRGARQEGSRFGPLLSTERIPWDRWETDDVDRIMVDGEYVREGETILIPGPHEGILTFGAGAIRRTADNLEAAANAAKNPSAYLELHYTGDDQMTDEQIDRIRDRWAQARRGEHGGVAFTNKWIEVREHGTHEAALLIDGRNADAVDMSRLVSSPAAMTDATSAGASLTYETSESRNVQLIDYGSSIYMDAIAARLSMDDVVPRGQRVAFDVTQLTIAAPSPTGAPTPD